MKRASQKFNALSTAVQEYLKKEPGTDSWQKARERLVDLTTHQVVHSPTFTLVEKPVKPPAERTATIHYDGGNGCNIPGRYGMAYGSFTINGGSVQRVQHGVRVSNNAAECLTAIAAIRHFTLGQTITQIATTRLVLISDSKISLNAAKNPKKVAFKGKPSSPEFLAAAHELLTLCQKFHSLELVWKPRQNSVNAFGH